VMAAFLARSLGSTWLILGIGGIFFAGIAALYYTRREPRLFVARTTKNKMASSRVVPLTKDTLLEQKN